MKTNKKFGMLSAAVLLALVSTIFPQGGVLGADYPTTVKGDGKTISHNPASGKDDVVLSAITGEITDTSGALVDGKTVYGYLDKLLYQNSQVNFGTGNTVSVTSAYKVAAYGADNTVGAASTVALGVSNKAEKENSIAIGTYNVASKEYAIAIGTGRAADVNAASGEKSIAIGFFNTASGTESTALGQEAKATGGRSLAIGYYAQATNDTTTTGFSGQNVAVGASSAATNFATAAFGASSKATGWGAVAIGYKANASGAGSIAIGNGSIADEALTVSVGGTDPSTHQTTLRRIVNVEKGTEKTDAATVGQLLASGTYSDGTITFKDENGVDAFTVTGISGGGSGGASYSAGDHIDLTGNKISVTTDGAIDSGDTGIVTGGTVYAALLKKGETYAISASQNTAQILNNDNSVAFTISVAGLDTGGGSASGTGENSLQIGKDAEATKKNSIAFGVGAKAMGDNSIAIGTGHQITGKNSGAFGDPTIINSDNSYSVGNNNEISGENTFVLGNNVKTSAKNAVILGDGSMATEDNVVSVGAEGNERKIINVKAGENSTDAVNKKQMEDAIDEALADIGVGMTEQLHRMDHDIAKVGAGAAALAALHPENFDPADKWSFAVGYGHYKNANSGALGAFYKPNFDTTLSIGSTIGNGDPMLNAGVSFKLGRRSEKLSQNASNSQLVQEVNALRADNNRLRDDSRVQAEKIERLEAQVAALLAKVGNR